MPFRLYIQLQIQDLDKVLNRKEANGEFLMFKLRRPTERDILTVGLEGC